MRFFPIGHFPQSSFASRCTATAGLATAVVSLAALSSSLGEVWPVAGDGGASELPRMTGKPSLALPMITTFELLDCAS